MKRYKQRACPGCGNESELPPQRLCFSCQDKMREADILIKERKSISNLEKYNLNILPISYSGVDGSSHNPHYLVRKNYLDDDRRFEDIFKDLIVSVAREPIDEHPPTKTLFNFSYQTSVQAPAIVLSVDSAKYILELYKYVDKIIQEIYNHGLKHGKNLLIGLNKGTVSMDDFENNKLTKKGYD